MSATFGDARLPLRFWSKILPVDDGCWIWIGSTCPKDYGTFRGPDGIVKAHRFAYEALVGPIAAGLHLDHLCRVHCCVNPDHLEPVTPQENQRRGLNGVLTTHCPQGHPYSGWNLMFNRGGKGRLCRACIYEGNRRRNALVVDTEQEPRR